MSAGRMFASGELVKEATREDVCLYSSIYNNNNRHNSYDAKCRLFLLSSKECEQFSKPIPCHETLLGGGLYPHKTKQVRHFS
jgi:hypothetical protein